MEGLEPDEQALPAAVLAELPSALKVGPPQLAGSSVVLLDCPGLCLLALDFHCQNLFSSVALLSPKPRVAPQAMPVSQPVGHFPSTGLLAHQKLVSGFWAWGMDDSMLDSAEEVASGVDSHRE